MPPSRKKRKSRRVKPYDREISYVRSTMRLVEHEYPMTLPAASPRRHNKKMSVKVVMKLIRPPYDVRVMNEARKVLIPDLFTMVSDYLGKIAPRPSLVIEDDSLLVGGQSDRLDIQHQIFSQLSPYYKTLSRTPARVRGSSSSVYLQLPGVTPLTFLAPPESRQWASTGLPFDHLVVCISSSDEILEIARQFKARGNIVVGVPIHNQKLLESPIWDAVGIVTNII